MGIKMIVTDLDGTLLNAADEISKQDKDALLLAKQQGIMVIIATGRPLLESQEYIDAIESGPYFIGMNGCQTLDLSAEKAVAESFLSSATVQDVYRILNQTQVFYEVYTKREILAPIQRKNKLCYAGLNEHYLKNAEKMVHFVENIEHCIENVHKFFIPADSEELAGTLYEKFYAREDVSVFNSLGNFIEVVPKGCDKAIGLHNLCQSSGVRPEEILAIGDSENDLGMLSYAGVGVAMGNAKVEVKNIARWIVSANDRNGVAEAVQIALRINAYGQ